MALFGLYRMIRVQIDGIEFDGFLSGSVRKSFLDLSSVFSLSATNTQLNFAPLKVGSRIKIFVEDTPLLDGFIETVNDTGGNDGDQLTAAGRDAVADLIDSSLPPDIKPTVFNTPISIIEITKTILSSLGLSNLKVSANLSIPNFEEDELKTIETGITAFEFLEELAQTRQVILTSDGLGNLIYSRASTTKLKTILLNEPNGTANNILSASASVDFTERFNQYRVFAQGNPSAAPDTTETTENISKRFGVAIDDEIRTSRILTIITSQALNIQSANKRAQWEKNIRRAESRIYRCTVQGLKAAQDGIIWTPNTLIEVQDFERSMASIMLINTVSYEFSNQGSTTILELISPDAFTIQETVQESSKNKLKDNSNFDLNKYIKSVVG